jgi:hypothetical protein
VTSAYKAGQRLHVTGTGDLLIIWDAAPGIGNYWAHLLPGNELVKVHVQHRADALGPIVTIKEEWE